MVDHDDFADVFDAGEAFDRAGLIFDRFAAFGEEIAMEESVDQGGLPRARDAGHAGENAKGKIGIELFDVVQRGAAQSEKLLRFAALGWNGNVAAT
ncbi:MAG: hypothetical protein ACKOD5_10780, partial [Chthoniobacterales bacterium]